MATVRFLTKGKKNPTNLYCRFVNTKAIDITSPINVFINPIHWDHKNQKIKNVIAVKNRDELNKKLTQLKIHILDDFNLSYMNGEIIDNSWLVKSINKFYNRPSHEVKKKNLPHTIYLSSFANWWIENKAPTWVTGKNKYLNERAKQQYKSFIKLVEGFEGKDKIKLKETTNETINSFVDYLDDDDYSSATIKRHANRFKFFCFRAEESNLDVNKNFKQRVFIPEPSEIKAPYLNPEEIEKIFNHDFSNNEVYDSVRDNLIIAVWTGLRISDFLYRLNIENFIDDFIEIETLKTKTWVTIPIHPNIKQILIKRNGKLPKSTTKFNENVKKVCQAVGIKNVMKGRLQDPKTNRKVSGNYPKYKLISSHIGRRSFATNHFGKIKNQTLMKICGWSTEAMMMKYIKKSDRSYAVELQEYWNQTIEK